MDKIEEIKKIIDKHWGEWGNTYDSQRVEIAKQICQLFEPKPDQARLLKGKEIMQAHEGERCRDCGRSIAEAQDAWTASIVRAECEGEFYQWLAHFDVGKSEYQGVSVEKARYIKFDLINELMQSLKATYTVKPEDAKENGDD